MGDINKLPKWAQSQIKLLQRDLDELKGERANLTGISKSAIFIEGFGVQREKIYLPDDARITIQIDRTRHFDFNLNKERGIVKVYGNGGDDLLVRSRATNHIELEVEEHGGRP